MTEKSESNPQIIDGDYSPLEALIVQSLRRFGDFNAQSADGNTILLLLDLANSVIDDVRTHPYWDGTALDYYTHPSETREIPDSIMRAGLLYYYSDQQNSGKTPSKTAAYLRTLNSQLWYRLNGNTAIQMIPTDGGSNIGYAIGTTNETNGLVTE